MEYAPGGNLNEYIKQQASRGGLGEEEARRLFSQVVDAVHYLHTKKDIAHRDIKVPPAHHALASRSCDVAPPPTVAPRLRPPPSPTAPSAPAGCLRPPHHLLPTRS